MPTPTRVAGTTTTVNNLASGVRLVLTVDCPTTPTGRTAMGGGAQILPAAANTFEHRRLVLQSSFPADADTWQIAVLATDTINSAARSFLVTPFVICT